MKVEDPISQLYLCQINIVHNLSVGQQSGLEDIGCSKELLSFFQGAAIGLMVCPVPFLAVAATQQPVYDKASKQEQQCFGYKSTINAESFWRNIHADTVHRGVLQGEAVWYGRMPRRTKFGNWQLHLSKLRC
jgi:hypothetical protein